MYTGAGVHPDLARIEVRSLPYVARFQVYHAYGETPLHIELRDVEFLTETEADSTHVLNLTPEDEARASLNQTLTQVREVLADLESGDIPKANCALILETLRGYLASVDE